MVASLKAIGLSLALILVAAAIPVEVPGLWGPLFVLLWAATVAGALWGGWRAGSAVLILIIGALFNLPLILGKGGARYVVWEVGGRALAAACAAWLAGWLLRRRGPRRLTRLALILFVATALGSLIALWLQRGDDLELLPVTLLAMALTSFPVALLLRSVTRSRAREFI